MTENQYRRQNDLEAQAKIEVEMLRRNEQGKLAEVEKSRQKQEKMNEIKVQVQNQLQEKEMLREEAQKEFMKERDQVDAIINKMIEEDHEMMKI